MVVKAGGEPAPGEGEYEIHNPGPLKIVVGYASGGSDTIAPGGKLRVCVRGVMGEDGVVRARCFPRGWKPVGSS